MKRSQTRNRRVSLRWTLTVAATALLFATTANANTQQSFWEVLRGWTFSPKPAAVLTADPPAAAELQSLETTSRLNLKPVLQPTATHKPVRLQPNGWELNSVAVRSDDEGPQVDTKPNRPTGETLPKPSVSARPEEAQKPKPVVKPVPELDRPPREDADGVETDAMAFEEDPDFEVIDIEHDADELRDIVRPRPADVDVADTVLVFTNTMREVGKVRCHARNRAGEAVGGLRTNLPAGGIGFFLASDFSDGGDYVGRAHCKASRGVIATAIFLGPEITDLKVASRQARRPGASNHQFPLIATY